MPTIFVVDDDPDVLAATLALFSKHGYEAVGATNGLNAIQILRKVNPDLIITDIVMPQMSGFQFLKELKNSPLTSAIPVLVISGHAQMVESFSAMKLAGFLIKPFSTKELLLKVQEVLDVKEEQDDG